MDGIYKQKSFFNFFSSLNGANENSAFDQKSSSKIVLNNNTVLIMRQVSNVLALVWIMRHENYDKNVGLMDYNFTVCKTGLNEVFKVREEFAEKNQAPAAAAASAASVSNQENSSENAVNA